MPGRVAEIRLASSMSELNQKSELPHEMTRNPRKLAKVADKIYTVAKEQRLLGNEEQAYIQIMKYLNIHAVVRGSLDYKKDKSYFDGMISIASVMDAMNQAEELAETLKKRYDERNAEIAAAKLAESSAKLRDSSQDFDELDDLFTSSGGKIKFGTGSSLPAARTSKTTDVIGPPPISTIQLYDMLHSDENSHILIIDTREENDYNQSHIKLSSVDLLNIPGEHLTPGILTNKLRGKLNARSQSLFDARANYNKIILLDWDSTSDDLQPSHPLSILKDAIYKWDQQMKLASEPQILEGGYDGWLMYYPQLSTDPSIRQVKLPTDIPDVPDLSNISYDFFQDDPEPSNDLNGDQPITNSDTASVVENQPMATPQTAGYPNVAVLGDTRPTQTHIPTATSRTFPTVNRSNKPNPVLSNNITGGRTVNSPQPAGINGIAPAGIARPLTSQPTGNGVVSANHDRPQPGAPAPAISSRPMIDRNLKPAPQPSPRQSVIDRNSSEMLSQEELCNKLREQNVKMIAEAGDRLKQLNADRAQIADLSKIKQSEAEAVADLMRKHKDLEEAIKRQEEQLRTAQQVQVEHDITATPQINRDLKPNLEDWELRLTQLQIDNDAESSKVSAAQQISPSVNVQQLEEQKKQEARLRAEQQSKLVEEQNRQAKEQRVRKEADERSAERARAAEERLSVEKARVAEEQRKAAERKAAAAAKLVEKQRLDEQAKIAEEKARLLEENRKAAEKKKLEEQREAKLAEERVRLEQERTKLAEEQRLAAEREKQAEQQRNSVVGERGPSTNELPQGWQRKLDGKGNPFYINYKTGEETYTPPIPTPPLVKPPAGAVSRAPASQHPKVPTVARQPPARPAQSQGAISNLRSTTRLKSDETTFGIDGEISSNVQNKSKLKKFNSIPNLTKIDDDSPIDTSSALTLDRASKPGPIVRQQSQIQPLEFDQRRLQNLSPEYGHTTPGLTGLYNMGNTCYMNSALQCLSHTVALYQYFTDATFQHDINRESTKGSRGSISTEFALLLKCLWTGSYRYVVPRDFKFVFGRMKSDFDHYRQMDSQEFLQKLIDSLHEDLNSKGHCKVDNTALPANASEAEAARHAYAQYRSQNESIIATLFTGQQRSSVICPCGSRSNTFDNFNFLPLEINTSHSTTLQACLKQYLKDERIDGYKCEKCGRRQSSRKLDLYRMPSMLLIFFKRFNQFSTSQFSKKTNYIEFGETLSLKGLGDKGNTNYRLYGVVNHFGSLDSGHYTSFCKSVLTNKWHKFNDENVSTVKSFSDVKSSAAYILFYTSISVSAT